MSEQLIATPSVFGETGNFLLERELGQGGMGGVYLGRDKMLDRPVAVKVMLKEYGDDAAFVENFKKEAQSVARLIHPNIAQVYSYGIAEGMPYIAMELVSGGSLYSVMKNAPDGKTDVTRVLKICEQVAQAVRCASDQGIVHGDIKPENILLDANGNAKIIDFGLAAMQKNTDEIWGTPYYIAPEKVKKEPVDFRADIYSLGGTLYHALTGVAPFEGTDAVAVIKKRFEGAPKKPSEIRTDLTPQIDALVMKMLALEKTDRFPSMEALLNEFKRVLETGLAVVPATGAAPAAAPTTGAAPGPRKMVRGRRMMRMRRPGATTAATSAGADGGEEGEDGEGENDGEKSVKLPKRKKPIHVSEDEEEEEEEGGSVGMKVVGVVVGVILLIGAVIGGLVWYKVADANSRKADRQSQVDAGISKAREAIAETRGVAAKFADEFEQFSEKAVKECQAATEKLQKILPDFAQEMVIPPTQELLDAIASTNEVVESAAPADTNAVAAAAAGTNAVAAAGTNATAAAAGAAPAPAPAATEPAPAPAPAGEAKPEKKTPAVVQDVRELWERAYSCQACSVRIRHQIRLLLRRCDAADEIKGNSEEEMTKLAELSREIVDKYGEIKASKDVENVRKGITFIKSKGEKSVKQTVERLRIEKLEADRKARKEAEAAEEKARLEAKKAEHAKKVAEEVEAVKAKYASLEKSLTQLDWKRVEAQFKALSDRLETADGKIQVRDEMKKVNSMRSVQNLFIKNLPDYTFKKSKLRGCTVKSIDEKNIRLLKPDGRTSQNMTWTKFYREYHGNLNEIIINFIEKGRENLHLGLKAWSDAMLGTALSLQLLWSDVNGAPEKRNALLKAVVEAFPDRTGDIKKMFPDFDPEAKKEE